MEGRLKPPYEGSDDFAAFWAAAALAGAKVVAAFWTQPRRASFSPAPATQHDHRGREPHREHNRESVSPRLKWGIRRHEPHVTDMRSKWPHAHAQRDRLAAGTVGQ